jgi:hypothetical protein
VGADGANLAPTEGVAAEAEESGGVTDDPRNENR